MIRLIIVPRITERIKASRITPSRSVAAVLDAASDVLVCLGAVRDIDIDDLIQQIVCSGESCRICYQSLPDHRSMRRCRFIRVKLL